MKHIITGANGFLGSHLVAALLERGETVVALARGNASERMRAALKQLNCPDKARNLYPLSGDITTGALGSLRNMLKRVDTFWHIAADTRFTAQHAEEIIRVNLDGTRHALWLADKMNVTTFIYISTAYVCGDYKGIFPELPHPSLGQTPRNAYEKSKLEAEELVTKWAKQTGRNYLILRPGIIAGDSVTGMTNLYNGYYGFMKGWWQLKHQILTRRDSYHFSKEIVDVPIAIPGHTEALLSITTIDYVLRLMLDIASLRHIENRTYHLVSSDPKTFGWWLHNGLRILGIEGVSIDPDCKPERGTAFGLVQRQLISLSRPYIPYVSGEPRFAMENLLSLPIDTSHPTLDVALLERLLQYAIEHEFGEAANSGLQEYQEAVPLLR